MGHILSSIQDYVPPLDAHIPPLAPWSDPSPPGDEDGADILAPLASTGQ